MRVATAIVATFLRAEPCESPPTLPMSWKASHTHRQLWEKYARAHPSAHDRTLRDRGVASADADPCDRVSRGVPRVSIVYAAAGGPARPVVHDADDSNAAGGHRNDSDEIRVDTLYARPVRLRVAPHPSRRTAATVSRRHRSDGARRSPSRNAADGQCILGDLRADARNGPARLHRPVAAE